MVLDRLTFREHSSNYLAKGRVDIEEKRTINVPASHFTEMSLIPAETKSCGILPWYIFTSNVYYNKAVQ